MNQGGWQKPNENKKANLQKSPQELLKIHLRLKLAYQNKTLPELKLEGNEGKLKLVNSLDESNLESKSPISVPMETSKIDFQAKVETKTETTDQPQNLLQPYFLEGNVCLFQGDCVELMRQMPANYVDMIFADPPYFLSEKDESRQPTNFPVIGTNYKGEWDVSNGFKNNFKFQQDWIKEAKRILKPEGTIWITGTHHSIYQCGVALQAFDYKILNEISWYKPKSKYYTKSYFNFSHETIIWARKSKNSQDKHHFNARLMNQWRGDPLKDSNPENPQSMRTVWQIEPPSKREFVFGRHSTQKPLQLLQRIILASSKTDAIILDPFNGSGTTGVVIQTINQALQKAGKLEDLKQGRKYIGIDRETQYLEITKKRLESGRNKGKE